MFLLTVKQMNTKPSLGSELAGTDVAGPRGSDEGLRFPKQRALTGLQV